MGVRIELCNINLNRAIVTRLSSNFIFNWGVYVTLTPRKELFMNTKMFTKTIAFCSALCLMSTAVACGDKSGGGAKEL